MPPVGVPGDNQRIDWADNNTLGSVYLLASALRDAEIDGADDYFVAVFTGKMDGQLAAS